MKRVLSLTDLFVIAAASIGPAFSLATTFGPMVAAGGSGTPIALAVVAAIMVCVALAYRRLGARHPDAGSAYAWVRIAFGHETGAYAAWVLIVANIFAVVATSVPAGTYTLSLIAPSLVDKPIADALVGALWVLAAGILLYFGIRPTARVTYVLLVAEIVILAVVAVAAFLHPIVTAAVASIPSPNFIALMPAIIIGIWMIDGWEVSASTAEESHGHAQMPGIGGLIGLLIAAAILSLCMTAFVRVGSADAYAAHVGDAMGFVGSVLGGNAWRLAISIMVLVSLAASLQTTLVYLTRSFYALGRDRVLPPALGRLDNRLQPAAGIALITALGMFFTILSGTSPTLTQTFGRILGGTSFFLGLLFLMSAAAAVRLFARDRTARIDGVVLPGIAVVALTIILGFSLVQGDGWTRAFILASAAVGIPLAWWRGRASGAHM
jgi:amino acid transporter